VIPVSAEIQENTVKTLKIFSVLAICFSLFLLAFSVQKIGTASADPGGGLLSKPAPTTLASGATSYTTSSNTSLPALNVFEYGSIQVQATVDVTGSQVLTVIPQFTNQPSVNCAVATGWFTATQPLVFATSDITPTTSFVNESFTITGDGSAAREVPTQGRCFRLMLDFSAAGQVYTPTVYVRPVNRY
jgi:hypothetical protein